MIPNLPRELLWTDKTDISEFMPYELGNHVESLVSLKKTGMKLSIDGKTMLMLYNEAFYLSTRVMYEHDANANPEVYMEKIIADIGNKKLSELVLFIMFVVVTLQSNQPNEVQQFVDSLQKKVFPQTPFKIVNRVNKMPSWMTNILRKLCMLEKFETDFRLKPCPYSADELRDIDWYKITQGFSKHVIIDILNLWDNDNEKGKVIRLIENAYTSHQPELDDKEIKEKADGEFFIQQKNLYNVSGDDKDTKAIKVGRPEGKSLDELFTDTCSPAQRDRLIQVVRKLKGQEAVYTLRVAALEDVGIIKKVPSYKKAKEYFPNIGASSGYYRYRDDKIKMDDNQIDYYKSLLIP